MVNIDFFGIISKRDQEREVIMSYNQNLVRSEEGAALLGISMNENDQDSGEIKEIDVCQSGEALINVKLVNFSKPVKAGSLIFARGTLSEAMNRTKLVVDMNQINDRWVTLDSIQMEQKTNWSELAGLAIQDLSDAKTEITQEDVRGLSFMIFKKHVRCYKIVQYELTKENKKDLASEKPNYIKGVAYEKMFEIFKVWLIKPFLFTNIIVFRMSMESSQLRETLSLQCHGKMN